MIIAVRLCGCGETDNTSSAESDSDGDSDGDSGYGTENLGDVQRLPNGNTLVTYSNDSVMQEIDPDGNPVLEIHGGTARFGYAVWRESLYGSPPDMLL